MNLMADAPEPGGLLILGSVLIGFVLWRRFRVSLGSRVTTTDAIGA